MNKKISRKETTQFLSDLLISDRLTGMGKHYAREVTLGYGLGKGKEKRVDFIQFCPKNTYSNGGIEKGEFIFYEVKSCKADLNSGNGLNFDGERNYLVMTMDTYKECLKDIEKLPYYIGVLATCPVNRPPGDEFQSPTPITTPNIWWTLKVAKEAHLHSRERSLTELLFCMVRSGR